jgi:hypothetical protein
VTRHHRSHARATETDFGRDEATDHIRLALPDVLARIDAARARGASKMPLHTGRLSVVLDLTQPAGTRLYRLLTDAADRHFDTVSITGRPDCTPIVGVARRRHRPNRHT